MREIEAEINLRRGEAERKSDIPKTNFRGIELRHFSCEIARLALIIAEYVRNDNRRPRLVKLVAACGAPDMDAPEPAIWTRLHAALALTLRALSVKAEKKVFSYGDEVNAS